MGITNRAHNRRKTFYRKAALDLATSCETITLDMPDLKKVAKKVDQGSDEKTALAKKARSWHAVAVLYEFEFAIKWAGLQVRRGDHQSAIAGARTCKSNSCWCPSPKFQSCWKIARVLGGSQNAVVLV